MDRNEKQNSFKNNQNSRGIIGQVKKLKKELLIMRILTLVLAVGLGAASFQAIRLKRIIDSGRGVPEVTSSLSLSDADSTSESSGSRSEGTEETGSDSGTDSTSEVSAPAESESEESTSAKSTSAGSEEASSGSKSESTETESSTSEGNSAASESNENSRAEDNAGGEGDDAGSASSGSASSGSAPSDGANPEAKDLPVADEALKADADAILADTDKLMWKAENAFQPEEGTTTNGLDSDFRLPEAGKLYMMAALCSKLSNQETLAEEDKASLDALTAELLGRQETGADGTDAAGTAAEQRYLEMLGRMTAPGGNTDETSGTGEAGEEAGSTDLEKGLEAVNTYIRAFTGVNTKDISYSAEKGLEGSLCIVDAEGLFEYLFYLPSNDNGGWGEDQRQQMLAWLHQDGAEVPAQVAQTKAKNEERRVPWFSCSTENGVYTILGTDENDSLNRHPYVLGTLDAGDTDEEVLKQLADTVYAHMIGTEETGVGEESGQNDGSGQDG